MNLLRMSNRAPNGSSKRAAAAALQKSTVLRRDQRTLKFSADILPLFETSSNSTGLPLIETPEAGAFHCGDMYEDVLAAVLRHDEAITLGRIEPFHGTCRHLKLLQSCIAVGGM
jgi:hypothetical protein